MIVMVNFAAFITVHWPSQRRKITQLSSYDNFGFIWKIISSRYSHVLCLWLSKRKKNVQSNLEVSIISRCVALLYAINWLNLYNLLGISEKKWFKLWKKIWSCKKKRFESLSESIDYIFLNFMVRPFLSFQDGKHINGCNFIFKKDLKIN